MILGNGILDIKNFFILVVGYFIVVFEFVYFEINIFNGWLDLLYIEVSYGVDFEIWVKYDFFVDILIDNIIDVFGNGNYGILINVLIRVVKGYDWDGFELDWIKVKYGYGVIHFYEDDFDDVVWKMDFSFKFFFDILFGVYVVVVKGIGEYIEVEDYIIFFV